MSQRLSPIGFLTSIRSAYTDGVVPSADLPALLAVLNQHLGADEVARVATELVVRGASPHATVPVPAADVERVIGYLRTAGELF